MLVLHRDETLLVVDKPAGLLVHASAMAREADVALVRARQLVGGYVFPVHRLDRGTSGALAFALTEEEARHLGAAFAQGSVRKRYVALVRGATPDEIRIEYPIPKAEGSPVRVPAITTVRTLARFERASWIEAFPETGRFHQVRRHLKHVGHPLANDANYGTGWFNRWARSDLALGRLALHAAGLVLPRRDGSELSVSAPLPADLREALSRLGAPPHCFAAGA